MRSLHEIELFNAEPNLAAQEEFFDLYRNGESYIVYIRNFEMQVEFIMLSQDLQEQLPENLIALTNVYFKNNFFILLYFRTLIRQHVLESGQLNFFYALFDSSLTEFFEKI